MTVLATAPALTGSKAAAGEVQIVIVELVEERCGLDIDAGATAVAAGG